jgi:enoyl-CoA hydratase
VPEGSDRRGGFARIIEEGAVATLEFGRAEAGNALSNEALEEIRAVVSELGGRPDLRVLVVRSVGQKAFGSGMDLRELRRMTPSEAQRHFDILNAALRAIEECPLPSIAMVRGYALGGGCELAASCDLRIGAAGAQIGMPIGRFGHCPDRENLRRLSRLLSPAHLKAMVLTDMLVGADDAHRMGFFNWVVPDLALEAFTREVAASVSQKAPLGLRAFRRALAEALDGSIGHAADPAQDIVTALWTTRDFQEGVGAFLERRPPRFEGR